MERAKDFIVFALAAIAAYFDTTITFVYALLLGFSFNILAGLRADRVYFKMIRFPFFSLINFRGSKFKDSLVELAVILFVTYLLKAVVDLMHFDDKSAYAVQILIAIAVYYYLSNGLRNLRQAYPNNKWISAVHYIVSLKFRKIAPKEVVQAIDVAEGEQQREEVGHE